MDSPTLISFPTSPDLAHPKPGSQKKIIAFSDEGKVEMHTVADSLDFLNAKQFKYLWIDFQGVDDIDITEIGKNIGIDALTIEDCCSNFTRDKSELLSNNLLFVVSNENGYDENSNILRSTNINLLLFSHMIITIHSGPVGSLKHVLHMLESRYNNQVCHPDFILYAYLDGIIDLYMLLVQQVELESRTLDDLVLTLSSNELNEIMLRIDFAARRTVELCENLLSKKDMLAAMLGDDTPLLSKVTKRFLRNVVDHVIRLNQKMKLTKEVIHSLNATYMTKISVEMAMVSNDINITMRRFTAYGAVFLPLTLLSGIFGMNVKVPGMVGFEDSPPGYGWFIGLIVFMIIFAFIVAFWFHKKKWL